MREALGGYWGWRVALAADGRGRPRDNCCGILQRMPKVQREDLVAKLWNAGVPTSTLQRYLGCSHGAVYMMLRLMREQGVDVPKRVVPWRAPPGWRRCLDEIMAQAD